MPSGELRPLLAIKEIGGYPGAGDSFEKTTPIRWPLRKDDVAGLRIASNENLRPVEPKFGGQPDCLAASINKELCGSGQGKYPPVTR
jgi:hypothetical protein